MQETKGTIRCDHCKTEQQTKLKRDGSPKRPQSWKWHLGQVWCDKCWKDNYILRAINVPIAGPVDDTWEELRDTLHQCWSQATGLSNWTVNQLYQADTVRTPDQEKIAKFSPPSLYREACHAFPDIDPQSVSSILQSVSRKYKSKRYNVLWRCSESLTNYRYPTPYPVSNQSWSAKMGKDNEALLSVRLGRKRWTLRLRGGHQFRRQLQAHRKLANGEVLSGELTIYEVRATKSDHRNGISERDPGGGQKKHKRIMAKMAIWLPKNKNQRPKEGTLHVRTSTDALWTYWLENSDRIHRLCADHVKQWIVEHERKNERIRDDLKREKRWPKSQRRKMKQSQEARRRKHNNRIHSFIHESTSMLAKFAERKRVARVIYDDTNQSYLPSFAWYDLRQKLIDKLDERGIIMEMASNESVSKSREMLEKETAK